MTTLTANAETREAVRGSYAECVSAIADSYASGRIAARERDILLKLMLASLAEETLARMAARPLLLGRAGEGAMSMDAQPTKTEQAGAEPVVGDEEVADALSRLPEDARRVIMRRLSAAPVAGAAANPALRQLSPEHLDKMLDLQEAESKRRHQSDASAKRFQAFYFAFGIAVLTGLVVLFAVREQVEMVIPLVAAAGFLGWLGLGRRSRS